MLVGAEISNWKYCGRVQKKETRHGHQCQDLDPTVKS